MGIAQLIAGLIGQAGETRSKVDQERMMQDALARLKDIPLPVLKQMVAEQLQRPEAAAQDPALARAQREALSQMQGYAKGDISSADRAQMALAQNEAARRGQVQQNAILQGAQGRGQLGSGAMLAMQQQAAQGQNEGAYNMALQNMVNLRNRQYGAVGQSGQMAGQMSQQDLQRKAAADAVQAANARARMQAQGYNLGVPQRGFQNELQKWGLETGRTDTMGAQGRQNAQQQSSDIGNLGAGFGQLMGGDKGGGEQQGSQVYGTNTYTDESGKLKDYWE